MRLAGIFFLVFLVLTSCGEETEEVSFQLKAEGFSLEQDPDPNGKFGRFQHVLYGGVIYFETADKRHVFDLRGIVLEDYVFSLPAGEYILKAGNSPASLYGQSDAAYSCEPFSVLINEQTDTIVMQIQQACALALVLDEDGQLDHGASFIERHSYAHGFFYHYPFTSDPATGLYYAYFRPDTMPSDPTAFIWLYEGLPGPTEGGIPTFDMQIGHQYHISVLE